MDATKHIALVYHQHNQFVAQAFEKTFAKVAVQFEHLVCKDGDAGMDFNATFAAEKNPIVLLISDNFLKSEAAMNGAFPVFQQHISNRQISPIVIDGVDNSGTQVSTEFSRIGDIIKYMNFWQDNYLNLRSEARNRGEIDDHLESRIKNVREISTNIGEYLRFIRDQQVPHIKELVEDHFAVFKKQFNITGNITPGFFNRFDQDKIKPKASIKVADQQKEITLSENGNTSKKTAESEITTPEEPIAEISETTDQEHIIIPDLESAKSDIEIESITTQNIEVENEDELNVHPEPEVLEKEVEIEDEPKEKEPEIKMIPKKKFSVPSYLDDLNKVSSGEAEPINLEEKLVTVRTLLNNQDFLRAKNELDQLSEVFPRDARVWKYFGNIAEHQADYIQASTHYSRALELNPELPDLDYKVGLITSNFYPDQVDRAIQFFQTAVEKNPAHIDAHYQLGILLNEQKAQPFKAVPIFHKVLALDPAHEFANYDLALIYYDQGDKATGLKYYQKAFNNNPELKTPENDLAFGFSTENVIPIETKEPLSVKTGRPSVDKTVLITGATSGIGKATARAFAAAGYRLVICGRRENLLLDLEEELKSRQSELRYLSFDVRDIKSIESALNTLESPFSEIDLLINNAGLASGFDYIQDGDLRDWDVMIDTNVKGILNMVRLISPQMVERQTGHIINVCSTAGHEVYPKGSVYCATKHAVDALTKGMRLDLHAHGIKVGQVSPAHVEETEFAKVRFHGDEDRAKIYEDFNPLKSSDVADVILYIASQPAHVNIQDVLMMGTQQASSMVVDRTGRKYD